MKYFSCLLVFLLLITTVDAKDKPSTGSKPSSSTPKYGSGSTPKPAVSQPPKPVTPPTTPKYGSGSTPTPPPPTTPKYGSGASDKPTPPKTGEPKPKYGSGDKPVDPNKDKVNDPTKPKYGSGEKPVENNVGEKPKNTTYDSKAGNLQKREESKQVFKKGEAPATSYVNPKGESVKIDPRDKKIAQLRNDLSEEKWRNRELQQQQLFGAYYSRPVVVYHDTYSHLFWYWMLDRSIEQQALWAYHHRASMDQARYNDMLSRNAELAARVRALEASKTPVNETYQPEGMEQHQMYTDNYVKAVYNPAPVPPPAANSGAALTVLLYIVAIGLLIWLFVYLVFMKKWGQ